VASQVAFLSFLDLPEWRHVPADGLRAAVPAALPQLGVEHGGVADALLPPLMDPGLELVQLRFVEDPSRRPPDARAARVFFFTGVSPWR